MRRRAVLFVSWGEAFIVAAVVFLARLYDYRECSVLASVRVSHVASVVAAGGEAVVCLRGRDVFSSISTGGGVVDG